MTILVTGNKGYIGSVLTKMLLKKGYDVVGLDTNFYKGCEFTPIDYTEKQIVKDIRNISSEDLEGIGAIIHLAALSNDPLCDFNEQLTHDINFKATVRLAKLAKKKGIKRFVYSSSQSMYGIAKTMVYENSPMNPLTAYGRTKILSEYALTKLADDSFTPVYLRPSTVYGVSPMFRSDIIFNNLTASAFTTGKIFIVSDGTPWRPVIHIEDISSAFIAALEAPKELVHAQAFNVGEQNNYRVKDLASFIKKYFPEVSIIYSEIPSKDERSYQVNFEKIHKKLAKYYHPQWNLSKGIEQLFSAYKKFKLTENDFTDKYKRINHLKQLVKQNYLTQDLFWTHEKN